LVEVARQIDKSVSAVKRAVKKLTEAGKLRRVGSQKDGSWELVEE
jgi:DNA-binding Lrp family transcriptional regulator